MLALNLLPASHASLKVVPDVQETSEATVASPSV